MMERSDAHREKLVKGDEICLSYCYSDTNQDIHDPVILVDVPFSALISAHYISVLQFYKNKNRKRSVSNACGCFEMVEATGVEPVS